MFLPRLRAATPADLPELLRMAAAAGPGIGTLRPDPELLTARLHASQQAFATVDEEVSGEERYLFVLDDGRGGLLGCSGISACAGYGSRFYAYRNEFVVASSARLAVRTRSHTLQLTHDLTGATLLTSFYLDPAAAPMLGELLSRARLLFIHQFAARFAERVAALSPAQRRLLARRLGADAPAEPRRRLVAYVTASGELAPEELRRFVVVNPVLYAGRSSASVSISVPTERAVKPPSGASSTMK